MIRGLLNFIKGGALAVIAFLFALIIYDGMKKLYRIYFTKR